MTEQLLLLSRRQGSEKWRQSNSFNHVTYSIPLLSKSSGKTYLRYHFMVFAMNKLFALAFYGVCLLITSFGASSYGV